MRRRTTGLFLACLVAAALPMSALRALADNVTVDGGSCVYNGSTIVDDIKKENTILTPGSSVTTSVDFTNSSASSVNVYLSNSVTESLEKTTNTASGAAYTYRLSYSSGGSEPTILYDSSKVGGDDSSGLMTVTLSANSDSAGTYYYLGQLAAGASGTVYLTVGLDGETTVNNYQLTTGQTALSFAVERIATTVNRETAEETRVVDVQGENVLVSDDGAVVFSSPRTSDETQLWLFVVILGLCSLGLGVCFALKVFPQGKKKGGQPG